MDSETGRLAREAGEMPRLTEAILTDSRPRLGLQAQLLALLLAFGAIPLALAIVIGNTVSGTAMINQAELALRELARRQSDYLQTEVRRQRLLLRTITGQLTATASRLQHEELSGLLASSLSDDGVFDGLRLIESSGNIIADVALRRTAPHWPDRSPAFNWQSRPGQTVVHRAAGQVVAYILAAPVQMAADVWWLEGHVRADDFARLFNIKLHVMGGAEFGIFEQNGDVIVVPHAHAERELGVLFERGVPDSLHLGHASIGGIPSVVFTAPLPEMGWILGAALPLDIVLAPVKRLRNAALVGGAGLVAIIFLAGHLAARFVTTPLRELSAAASRFGETGSYDTVRHRGVAETAALVESFRKMASSLAKSRGQIERLHAQEMERAHQLATVGELASGVAHEVRNPLTGVLGALEIAARRLPENDSALPMLQEAQAQLQRIEATTTRLLEYARPPDMRQMVVDAKSLVDRAARVVDAQVRAAGITLHVEPASTLLVRADPELLVQVLVNLLLNGIDATSNGGELRLWISRHGHQVWIGVRDTGTGIPPDKRSAIFRPFFTTKNRGTGLGLPISQQIVVRHGGSLQVEETPGGGSTFVVALPLAEIGEDHS